MSDSKVIRAECPKCFEGNVRIVWCVNTIIACCNRPLHCDYYEVIIEPPTKKPDENIPEKLPPPPGLNDDVGMWNKRRKMPWWNGYINKDNESILGKEYE